MDSLDRARPGSARVFLSYALPATAGLVLTTAAVVADGLFVGRVVGAAGLAAVNLSLPLLYVFLAIGVMVGVGGASLCARMLGAGDAPGARRVFSGSMLLIAAAAAAVAALVLAFAEPLLALLGAAPGGEAYAPAREYLATMAWFYVLTPVNVGLVIFLRFGGSPLLALAAGLAGSLLDIGLDWLFILRLGMGMRGAALSSGLGALAQALLAAALVLLGRCELKPARPRLSRAELASILGNGSSELIGQLSVTITVYLFNSVLMRRLGVAGVAAYTVAGYLSFVESMLVLGCAQALVPLAGRSAGAGDRAASRAWLGVALRLALAVAAAAAAVALAAPGAMARLFSKGGEAAAPGVVALAREAIVFTALAFIPGAFSMIAASYLTALGDAKGSALIASLRGLVLLSAFVLVLPLFLGDSGVWMAVPATELATFAVSVLLLRKSLRGASAALPAADGAAAVEGVPGQA